MAQGALKLNANGSVGQQFNGSAVAYADDDETKCCCGSAGDCFGDCMLYFGDPADPPGSRTYVEPDICRLTFRDYTGAAGTLLNGNTYDLTHCTPECTNGSMRHAVVGQVLHPPLVLSGNQCPFHFDGPGGTWAGDTWDMLHITFYFDIYTVDASISLWVQYVKLDGGGVVTAQSDVTHFTTNDGAPPQSRIQNCIDSVTKQPPTAGGGGPKIDIAWIHLI